MEYQIHGEVSQLDAIVYRYCNILCFGTSPKARPCPGWVAATNSRLCRCNVTVCRPLVHHIDFAQIRGPRINYNIISRLIALKRFIHEFFCVYSFLNFAQTIIGSVITRLACAWCLNALIFSPWFDSNNKSVGNEMVFNIMFIYDR